MIALSVALAAAPSITLLLFFYLKDRYEPEPRAHVLAAFALGALAIAPSWLGALGLERLVSVEWLALGGWPARLFEAGLMAAGTEELSKWLLFVAIVYRWQELDEPLDGVVYGVAAALGFATVENVLCVVRDGLAVGLLRALFAVPAHALFGAAMGYFMGRAKLGAGQHRGSDVTTAQRRARLALAFAVPLLFHTAYDFLLLELRGPRLFVAVGALSIALWAFALRGVRRGLEDSPFKPL